MNENRCILWRILSLIKTEYYLSKSPILINWLQGLSSPYLSKLDYSVLNLLCILWLCTLYTPYIYIWIYLSLGICDASLNSYLFFFIHGQPNFPVSWLYCETQIAGFIHHLVRYLLLLPCRWGDQSHAAYWTIQWASLNRIHPVHITSCVNIRLALKGCPLTILIEALKPW